MSLVPLALALPAAASALDDRLLRVGLFFLRAGALLFGSGMVLFAFVQRDIVSRYGWLTQHQLLDAIAVGQMVPGPASAAATVIGYLVAGWPGGVLATIGIFLPSFAVVAVTGPWLPRLRQSRVASAFLRGVNAAVVALILSVGVTLLRAAVVDVFTAVLLALALAALLVWEASPVWLLLGGLLVAVVRYLALGP
jgi:chromate transporter